MVEEAREAVAALAGAKPERRDLHQRRHRSQCAGAVRRGRRRAGCRGKPHHAHLVSAIEHTSVLATADSDRRTRRLACALRDYAGDGRWRGRSRSAARAAARRQRPRAGRGDGRQQRNRRGPAARRDFASCAARPARCCWSMRCRRRARSRSMFALCDYMSLSATRSVPARRGRADRARWRAACAAIGGRRPAEAACAPARRIFPALPASARRQQLRSLDDDERAGIAPCAIVSRRALKAGAARSR